MDGSPKTNRVNGALFRPVSLSQALDQFVPLIYDMICRKTMTTTHSACDGVFSVLIYGREGRFWTLRTEDYEKCLSITRKFTQPILFPSSPQTTIEQIKTLVSVEFADRK